MMKVVLLLGLLLQLTSAFKQEFQASGGPHPLQLQAIATFEMNGVTGFVQFTKRTPYSHAKASCNFAGLDSLPNDDYGVFITEYPVDFIGDAGNNCRSVTDICGAAAVGSTYDPQGNLGTLNYEARCQDDDLNCAVGDLVTRHGSFSSTFDKTGFSMRDFNIPLTGSDSIIGRAVVLQDLTTGENLACANIVMPAPKRILRATFTNVLQGDVYIEVPQYNYHTLYLHDGASIYVDLQRADGGQPNTANHQWNLREGLADASCNNLRPVLGVAGGMTGGAICSPMDQRACPLGDLTTKCGPLSIMNSRMREYCTDSQMSVVPFSTLDNLVMVINDNNNQASIMDCAQLEEVYPVSAMVDIIDYNTRARVNMIFTQPSIFSQTYYRTYLTGLNGQVNNIVVYDGDSCDALGDILDCDGRSPIQGSADTCDQYPIGSLGPKIGGLEDETTHRSQGYSTCMPLSGPDSIVNKPLVIEYSDGTSECGIINEVPNAPGTDILDINDYLDLFRPSR